MKKIDWSKSERLKKLEDENTPFMEIDIDMGGVKANARLYWTSRGMYGHQVQTILRTGGESYCEKTTGCGYSKTAHALTSLFEHLKIQPEKYTMDSDRMFDYHIGGNYYRINP